MARNRENSNGKRRRKKENKIETYSERKVVVERGDREALGKFTPPPTIPIIIKIQRSQSQFTSLSLFSS